VYALIFIESILSVVNVSAHFTQLVLWIAVMRVSSVSVSQLKDSLQGLPQSLSQLVHYSLERLCSQHRGMMGLRWALAALTVSATGKISQDLMSF